MKFTVWILGFRVYGSGGRGWDLGLRFKVYGYKFRLFWFPVSDLRLREGLRFEVQDIGGFRV